jgi:hypothetical protein
MHDIKHVTTLRYIFTVNAKTNTPRPSCPDAVDMGAEVEVVAVAVAVAVAHPIPSSLTPLPLLAILVDDQ